ncbi:hypothetical protein IV54_GL002101 [Levilactobacillus paucivorans]|uniref:MucBP domain-containing protein n=1 Tax=Levilactobacillus paucivorans TaxID=616990 RepID=A0A0R2LU44_9LACO|nr:hypothetical protein [Levilactobacillus paucivorans]KRO03740.1 hypothetical protein IV54_GL002101 [Levilactobacillus paucivorans]
MSKLGIKVVAALALFVGGGMFTTTTAQASAYKITSTENITPTPYYLTSYTKTRYAWDKTHTKKMTVLNNIFPDVSVYVIQKVTLNHNGKDVDYFHIRSPYGGEIGYVTTQGFKKGFNPKGDEDLPYIAPSPARKPYRRMINPTTKKEFAKAAKQIGEFHFYKITKRMTFNIRFTAYTGNGSIKLPITIPAGTIVQGGTDSGRLYPNENLLNQKILSSGYREGLWPDLTAYTPSTKKFKRVKRPDYFPKNKSEGDFYSGGMTAMQYRGSLLSKQSVQITTDGYVEVRQNNPKDDAIVYSSKPATSVKIKRTRIKGHTRYLYLAKKLKGFKTTKVRYKGKHQYRLALVNLQDTYETPPYEMEADGESYIVPSDYYGVMHLGGKTFYTPYGQVPYGD